MKLEDRTYSGGRIEIDGNEFVNCQFNGTILAYKGVGPVVMSNCHFNGVTWVFEGPASNTIGFMRAMFHELGESGRRLVERTFEEIMQPTPPPPPGGGPQQRAE